MGAGEHQQVLPKIFCLIVPNISSGNPFVLCAVFQKFARTKNLGRKRGSIKIIRRIIFLSQCRKFSWGKLVEQGLSNFPVAKKFVDKRGGVSRFSVEKFFSHSAE